MLSPSDPSSPGHRISPEAYNAVIDALRPKDVRLDSVSFKKMAAQPGPLTTEASLSMPEIVSEAGTFFTIRQACDFALKASTGESVAGGHVTFEVVVEVGFSPPKEFWDVFLVRNIKLYTQPVLRELIAGLAMRAGLLARALGSVAVNTVLDGGKRYPEPSAQE